MSRLTQQQRTEIRNLIGTISSFYLFEDNIHPSTFETIKTQFKIKENEEVIIAPNVYSFRNNICLTTKGVHYFSGGYFRKNRRLFH